MFTLHASGVGGGIAIGVARVIRRAARETPAFSIARDQVDAEIKRLRAAVARAHAALTGIREALPADAPEEIVSFLGIHLMLLEDPALTEQPARIIAAQCINAEAALARHAEALDGFFKALHDPYLSGKSVDVAQVIHRIQGELLEESDGEADGVDSAGDETNDTVAAAAAINADTVAEESDTVVADNDTVAANDTEDWRGEIIVADDLSPADAIDLKRRRIAAFVTDLGGPISHTAILARSMRIPAIVGLHGATRYLRTGDVLVIDGKRGVVLVNPDAAALAAYQRRRTKILRRIQALDSLRDAESVTLDGEAVALLVNIELPEEIAAAASGNAHGVGLYRTEFLFMNRAGLPDEEEQFEVYADVVKRARRVVTIRTLDLGADKQVDGGRVDRDPNRGADAAATNPALGRRAIRLCLHDLSLFKPQLRAIYRAAAVGQVRIMVPMLSNIEELNQLFELLAQVKRELRDEGARFNPDTPVGGMVEVPAAAVAADMFAHRLDFLSIGTNDLIQYTLAIDRIDDEVNYLYDPLHPSVLRLIKNTIDAGRAAGIPVSMCGEMAGDTAYTRILLGLGLREFSMDPASLLEVKRQIRLTDTAKLTAPVAAMLQTAEPERLKQMAEEINR